MVKAIHFSTKPKPRKHLEVESAMERMINQMNQLNPHILQPRANKRKKIGEGPINSSMLQLLEDGMLFKRMSKFVYSRGRVSIWFG
jgi:hypothetical protein